MRLLNRDSDLVSQVCCCQPKGLFLGPQIQDQPHPAILFSILAPKIVNGKLTFQDVPQELNASLEQEVQGISGKPFTEQSNAFAQMRVIEMLNNLGYLDGDARLQREAPHKNGENWVVDLLLTVTAGPRYRVASLAVDGGPLLEGKDFSKFYALKAGEYSSRPPFGALGLQLRALYEHKGYADVEVEVAPSKNPAEARVSYRLTVKPGLLYHLRSLKIEHLNAEQEARVREIFGTKAGDVYDGSATTRVYHALPNEPLLHGLGFGFSPMPDRNAAAIDMTLSFYREGGEDTVTIK
jgi:outer membrane protein insertion porin family